MRSIVGVEGGKINAYKTGIFIRDEKFVSHSISFRRRVKTQFSAFQCCGYFSLFLLSWTMLKTNSSQAAMMCLV